MSEDESPLYGPRELLGAFDVAARAGVTSHLVSNLPAGVAAAEVRDAFVDRLGSRRAHCWQDVWDEWVNEGRGTIPLWVWRCETCRGRRIDVRRGRVCFTCAGTGQHRHTEHVAAHHAPRPPA